MTGTIRSLARKLKQKLCINHYNQTLNSIGQDPAKQSMPSINDALTIANLPLELLYMIFDHMTDSSSLSLKHTCRRFRQLLPETRFLAYPMCTDPAAKLEYLQKLERDQPSESRYLCSLCISFHPARYFSMEDRSKISSERACLGSRGVVEIHPTWSISLPELTALLGRLRDRYPISGFMGLAYPATESERTRRGSRPWTFPGDVTSIVNPIPPQNFRYCNAWFRRGGVFELMNLFLYNMPMPDGPDSYNEAFVHEHLKGHSWINLCPHITMGDPAIAEIAVGGRLSDVCSLRKPVNSLRCPACGTKVTVLADSFRRPQDWWVNIQIEVRRPFGKGVSALDPMWLAQLKPTGEMDPSGVESRSRRKRYFREYSLMCLQGLKLKFV